ncbi:SNF2 family N-terminal domain-containing protein [Mariannaea sp. PMI_226]|nr:SNF2 family N-terminal domain-containing protein [Mariannaea sp. PMI_226]
MFLRSGKRPYAAGGEAPVAKKAAHRKDKAADAPSGGSTSILGHALHQHRMQDEPMIETGPVSSPAESRAIYIEISDDDDDNDQLPRQEAATKTIATPPNSANDMGLTTLRVATSDDISSNAMTPVEGYDVCFGLLLVQATCARGSKLPTECAPVTLDFDGILLRAYMEGSTQLIAIVVSEALSRLVSECAITLTATICAKRQKVFATKEAAGYQSDYVRFCSLRIIVYGAFQQKDQVADILGNGELYLQHPGATEFNRAVKYVNPHYLLAPGQVMPEIEELQTYTCCAGREARFGAMRDALQEHEQGQIFKIFNTAYKINGPVTTIEPSLRLVTKLKRHQIEALVMMTEKEAGIYDDAQFPTMWTPFKSPNGVIRYQDIITEKFTTTRPPPIGGGVLADEMGLGKTLSMLSLICYSLDIRDKNTNLSQDLPKATLLVTPKSTIYGWEKQIKTHIHPEKIRWVTYHGPTRHDVWRDIERYDIVLTTYDTIRSDGLKNPLLFQHRWARIVLDEAHKIRNRTSKVFTDVCKLQAEFRWCLTGTPIQNYLDDFGALLAFIRVPHFENRDSFNHYLDEPIRKGENGGLLLLRKVVAATCLRRTKADGGLMLNLPQKTELVERVEMSRNDRRLYEFFKRFSYLNAGLSRTSKKKAANNILVLISMLRLICDHGEALLPESALTAWRNRDESALTWKMLESSIKLCVSCRCQIEEMSTIESATEVLGCGHIFCGSCVARSRNSESQIPCPKCSMGESMATRDGDGITPSQSSQMNPLRPQYPPSAKVEALLRNILDRQGRPGQLANPPKSVIFSYWTKMLDHIGIALGNIDLKFCRIDGQSSMWQRKEALETFSRDTSCNIILASMGAAGEGIDLTAANSVHIVEPVWNPMAEAQAVDRVHRIGQKQDVEVIRYIVNDSIESVRPPMRTSKPFSIEKYVLIFMFQYVQWVQMDKLRLISESLATSEPKSKNVDEKRWKKLLEFLE